mmetsp:Transcript_19132/g.41436  ORF Transcript_19132/g.41436 Transcript_19132/m.41436 type:complete len:104 (+) Transcript_19132:1093-1404(+)
MQEQTNVILLRRERRITLFCKNYLNCASLPVALPNRCTYPDCSAALSLVPSQCSDLEYVNDDENKWMPMLGAPYATQEIVLVVQPAIINSFMKEHHGPKAISS